MDLILKLSDFPLKKFKRILKIEKKNLILENTEIGFFFIISFNIGL
jgi:hypothetical protein